MALKCSLSDDMPLKSIIGGTKTAVTFAQPFNWIFLRQLTQISSDFLPMNCLNSAPCKVLDHIIDAVRWIYAAQKIAYPTWHNRQKLFSSILIKENINVHLFVARCGNIVRNESASRSKLIIRISSCISQTGVEAKQLSDFFDWKPRAWCDV